MFFLIKTVDAQVDNADNELAPPPEWTVPAHKENLKLTLIIDSVQMGNKVEKKSIQHTLDISFESDYIQIKGNLYLRIFISRNQEYGKKFYSWKWSYLRKAGSSYNSLGGGYYGPMEYNQPIDSNRTYGQGIGIEGEADYIMIYYRYKLE